MSAAPGGEWSRLREADEGRSPWAVLTALTLVALLVRLPGLNDGLWWDEIRTLVESVRHPLTRIVTEFPGDNQHTFYSVLAHFSIALFGEHAWTLRLPAMLLGVATVPMLYVFAREFVGRTEALLASLLLAVAYHHVWFSQNARGYTMLAFLALLASWFLLRGLRRDRLGDWVGYAVVAALGVYTHLTMLFLVATHGLICIGQLGLPFGRDRLRRWRRPAVGFLLAGIVSLVLYSPVLFEVREAVVQEQGAASVATPGWAVAELLRSLRVGLGSLVGLIAGAAIFLVGLWSYYKESKLFLGLFLLPGLLTGAAAVVLHRPVRPRFLFFLAGFALLIVVRGALEIGRFLSRSAAGPRARPSPWGIGIVSGLAVLSLVAIGIESKLPKQDFEGAMHFVEGSRTTGEPVVTVGGARYPYSAYYQRDWEPVGSLEALQAVRSRGRRVWVLFTLKPYEASRTPDLMHALDAECGVVAVFPGTLRDGEVTVCTMLPPRASPQQ